MERYSVSASYGTLNATRSAIALISAYDIHKDGLISRFLRGIFKERPTKPKYTATWDTALVLTFLKKLHPLKKLSLKEATGKGFHTLSPRHSTSITDIGSNWY